MHDPNWIRRVTLPMRRVNGQWEFLFGGAVPVRDGAFAELTVFESSIADADFLHLISREIVVNVLPEGATLQVALSDRSQASVNLRPDRDVPLEYWPAGTTRFVPVTIGPASRDSEDLAGDSGGLWMRHTGLDRCELVCSQVLMPAGFEPAAAQSPNHALTLLPKHHEKHRLSHTGNVYARVFYQESDDKWYPLAMLRDGVRHRAERTLIRDAWAQIEAELGWCRLPVEPKAKAKRRRGAPGAQD